MLEAELRLSPKNGKPNAAKALEHLESGDALRDPARKHETK